MYVGPSFVVLHMPKTGGGFVRAALRRELGKALTRGAPEAGRHPGWRDLPPELAARPVLVYVRNPWDWYASWYHFVKGRAPDSLMYASAFGGGANDFATTVRNACEGRAESRRPGVAERMAAGEDFYSARFFDFVGEGLASDRLTVGRYEALIPDLETFLARTGTVLPAGAGARMRSAERVNPSERGEYRDYYDDALRELVGRKCARIVERFGYAF